MICLGYHVLCSNCYDRTTNGVDRLRSSGFGDRSDGSRRDLYGESDEFRCYRYYGRYGERT